MFVEKVDLKSFNNYISSEMGYPVKSENGTSGIYLVIDTGSYGPQPEYMVGDFKVKSLNAYASLNEEFVSKRCRNYLLNTFDNYKSEYNKYIESQLIR